MSGIAQPTISSRITTLRALNRTYYLYDTGLRRLNVMKHFRINDSLSLYDSIIAATVVSGHDLDATLTLGNRSDLDIEIMKNGVEGEFYTKHMYNGCQVIHNPSGGGSEYPVTFMGRVGGNNVLYLRDAFGYFGYMGSGALTADRKVLLPDEGDGVGLDATLVTHTTGDPITVYDGTNTGYYDADSVKMSDASGNEAFVLPYWMAVYNTAGTAKDVMVMDNHSLSYGYTNSVGPVSHTATLFFSRPSFTGTTVDSLWFPSVSNDTLAVKGDITSFGNFATADLTFTGNRYHNVDKYNVDIDSANMFVIQDTSGNYALNINDTANYGNSLMYVSSRTDKTLRMSPSTSYLSRLFLQANASQNLCQLFAGNNKISLTETSSLCNMSFISGSANPAILVVDSLTRSIQINHLTGSGTVASVAGGTGAGTAPTITMGSGSTDMAGYIDVTTGTGCATDATVATITFGLPYATAPKTIILSPANKATQNLAIGQQCFVNQAGIATTTFAITSNGTALADATAYKWYYFIVQ